MRYAFANCLLDTESYQFRRDGTPVPLEPQVFDLLRYLAEHAGQVVTKDQLIDTIWGGVITGSSAAAGVLAVRALGMAR